MNPIYILIAAALIIVVPIAIFSVIRRSSSDSYDCVNDIHDDNTDFDDAPVPTESITATVISVEPHVAHGGSDLHPDHGIVLIVTFRTSKQTEVTLAIPEAEFGDMKPGDTGMLVTVGGRFFAFGEGEDIATYTPTLKNQKE